MGLELRHITRIETTFAFFNTDGDHGQSAITTDGDDWVYHNDDKSRLYVGARQYYYDGTNHYLDNDFGQVTLHDELLVEDYIRLRTNTANYLKFLSGSITTVIGGVDAITVDVDDVKIETYVTLAIGESVNDIVGTIAEPGDNSTICTEKAIVDYVTGGAGFWLRNAGGWVYPKTGTDAVFCANHLTVGTVGGDEGGQITLNFNGITTVGQTDDSWQIDIDDSENLRIFCTKPALTSPGLTLSHSSEMASFGDLSVQISTGKSLFLDTGTHKTSVNEFSTDVALSGNSDDALVTEKAIKAYVDGLTGMWSRVIGTSTNRLEPVSITDHIVLGSSVEPVSREWVSITAGEWEGMGFVATADDIVNAIRFSDTSSMKCEVGYDHSADQFIVLTNGAFRFRINYSDGLVRITERAIFGSGSIDPNDYNSDFAVYRDGSTVFGIISSNTGMGDLFFTDVTGFVYPGIISYHHGDDSMHFTVNGNKAMIINSSQAVSLKIGTSVNDITTTLADPGDDDTLVTEKAIATFVNSKTSPWTRNVGGYVYPTNIGDVLGIGTSTAPYTYGYDVVVYYNGNTQIGIVSSTTGTGSLYFGDGTGSANRGWVNYNHDGDYLSLGTANAERFTINEDSYGGVRFKMATNGMFFVEINSSVVFRVNDVGDVAIGSGNPSYAFEIQNFATDEVWFEDADKDGYLGGAMETFTGAIKVIVGGSTRWIRLYENV